MKILGISSSYHDASATLIVNGEVVFSSTEERFTLQKHDPSFPRLAAQRCLDWAGIKGSDLDLVAYHEEPEVKFSRALCTSLAEFPFSRNTFIKSMKEAITGGFWVRNELEDLFQIDPKKIICVPHHGSHAAQGFLGSGFSDAAILTVDAVGEWTSTAIFHGVRNSDGTVRLEPKLLVPFPHSLGLAYSSITAFLGFKVNDGECSTMALAAFGEPKFRQAMDEVLVDKGKGSYELDLSYFDFRSSSVLPVTEKFFQRFGPARPPLRTLHFSSFMEEQKQISEDEKRWADIAATIQEKIENHVQGLARIAKELTGSDNLCLAGGVSLNCVSNGKLMAKRIFKNHFIAPDPGDGGGSMGAAFLAHILSEKKIPKLAPLSVYCGDLPNAKDLKSTLSALPEKFQPHCVEGLNHEQLLTETVKDLKEGKIVGWVQGRYENGPRALGARSLLVDPSRKDSVERMSKRVKRRAAFRPYACSMTPEAAKVLLPDIDITQRPYRWMQSSAFVAQEHRAAVRAALHVDGSTRPQICYPEDHALFHALLKKFGEETGRAAVLLNTSFNESGFPLVSTALEAFLMFIKTDMDTLVVEDTIYRKRKGNV